MMSGSRTIVSRTWKQISDSSSGLQASPSFEANNWVIWDRGDEMWELKGELLRHFRVMERVKTEGAITERLELLRESAIPLEAIRQSVQGWEVTEDVEVLPPLTPLLQPSPQAKPAPPLASSPRAQQARAPQKEGLLQVQKVQGASLPEKQRQGQPLPEGQEKQKQQQTQGQEKQQNPSSRKPAQTRTTEKRGMMIQPEEPVDSSAAPATVSPPEKPSQRDGVPLEEHSLQLSYTHSMESWSSLSQWIPPKALFQPSLHHQAALELSGTQAPTYPHPKHSSANSQPSQAQHPRAGQPQHPRPYRPKPSYQEREALKRPLFI